MLMLMLVQGVLRYMQRLKFTLSPSPKVQYNSKITTFTSVYTCINVFFISMSFQVHPVLTDQEIVDIVTSPAETEEPDENQPADESSSEQAQPPSIRGMYNALDVIQRFTLTMSESADVSDINKVTHKLQRVKLLSETPNRMHQTSITDFMEA